MLIPRVKCRYLERSCARSNGVDRSRTARQKNEPRDRKSTRLNSSHGYISYAVFCLKKNIQRRVVRHRCAHQLGHPPVPVPTYAPPPPVTPHRDVYIPSPLPILLHEFLEHTRPRTLQ